MRRAATAIGMALIATVLAAPGAMAEHSDDPGSKSDCMRGGWADYGFRNQGQCIRFVNTGQDSRDHDNGGGDVAT
jgi:Spy/CpxP family protein refolding chaperone